MFTGIVQHKGPVVHMTGSQPGRQLQVELGPLAASVQVGGSVAVNGACLTATAIAGARVSFDVVRQTVDLTNLGSLKPGDMVNLELPLRGSDPIDGHFVLGHIDGLATLKSLTAGAQQHVLWFTVPGELAAYLIPRGSLALDGVSLTIGQVDGSSFSVALIPTTLKQTTLGLRKPGDLLNLETDYLAKIVLAGLTGAGRASDVLLLEKLRSAGFTDLDS